MKISEADITLYRAWQADWNKFAKDELNIRLDRKQRKALRDIQENRRISIRSGHAVGKDYLAAVASLCFLYLNYPSKVISTAPTGRQVLSIEMAEIAKLHKNAIFKLPGEVLASKIKIENEPDWFLEGFKASDKATEAWAGYHSPNMMIVATEASGLEQDTFNAIEGLLTGNSKLLLIFNPNRTSGEAYQSTRSPLYRKIKLSCLNSPNVRARRTLIPGQVDYDWVQEKIEKWCVQIDESEVSKDLYDFKWESKWYRPNDLFRVKVLGEFPKEAEGQLIPLSWAEAARDRWKANDRKDIGNLLLGVDVAGQGRDLTVKAFRRGNVLEKFKTEAISDHMQIAGEVKQILIEPDSTAFIDTIGEGAGVHSRLAEQKQKSISVKFSEGAKELKDLTGERTFANMRAYCLWSVRDSLDPQFDNIREPLMIPDDDELIQELTEPRYSIRSNGDILIEDKEKIKDRLKRSPDKFDALAMTYYPMPQKHKFHIGVGEER